MKTCGWLALGIVLVRAGLLPAAEDAKTKVARKEMKRLAGTWQAVSYALSGKKASAADLKRIQLFIDQNGKATAKLNSKTFIASTITVDPTQKPRHMDIAFFVGDLKGKTSLGIYKLEGDTLTICRSAPGKPRPTVFSSKPKSGHTLMSYRRVKPQDKKLRGTWDCVSAERDGKKLPKQTVQKLRLVLKKDEYATYRGDDLLFKSVYRLDPMKDPKEIDIIATEGKTKGQPAKGIYRVEGNTLKLCYGLPGKDRPRAFQSKPGSGVTLTVWKRR
jgi:uncharacterized protein (TIGR03067 family)